MNYKVWRRKSDNRTIGFCDEDYNGFEPGGNLKDYDLVIEAMVPAMPAMPLSAKDIKQAVLLADPTVPQSVKDYIAYG